MKNKLPLILGIIWFLHSITVFSYYQYFHLKKWLLTDNSFRFIKEILKRCSGQ
jgi:hypothetical protein